MLRHNKSSCVDESSFVPVTGIFRVQSLRQQGTGQVDGLQTDSSSASVGLKNGNPPPRHVPGKLNERPVSSSRSFHVEKKKVGSVLVLKGSSYEETCRSPPPLTVVGNRSGLLNSKQRYLNSPRRPGMEKSKVATRIEKAQWSITDSMNSLKLSPTKSGSTKWTTVSSSNFRASQYPDPMQNASPEFLKRIAEIAALEAETIRFEKSRKLKKK